MNYKETLQYIHNTPKFSRILGNDLLRKLLGKLGNPQDGLRFIHIAGTNGKGSAAVMLSEILSHAGYTTGLFTSPYIERFNERIKVNGKMIKNTDLARIATDTRNVIEKYDTPVSEFALDTAIAFQYFKEQNCDIVVLETGLGGRLDATNVISTNLVSVIMSIGLDHMQYLGETISEIAKEKCGIIKNDSYTVVYPIQDTDAFAVIKEASALHNNELIIAKHPVMLDRNKFKYDGIEYELGLGGEFQKYNAAAVLETINVLNKSGYTIHQKSVKHGLKKAFNPGRLEKLETGIILDGAHNLPAVSALCEALKKKQQPINLCVAMMEDKDISSCVELLSAIASSVIVTEINMPRCASVERLSEEFAKHGIITTNIRNPIEAVEELINITSEDEVACVCGSLYLAGIIRKNFKKTKKKYYVYILRCDDNSLYTGITTDIDRRFKEHVEKSAKGAKYTKTRNVKSIEAVWERDDRSSASKYEAYIKSLSKPEKEALIKQKQHEK